MKNKLENKRDMDIKLQNSMLNKLNLKNRNNSMKDEDEDEDNDGSQCAEAGFDSEQEED